MMSNNRSGSWEKVGDKRMLVPIVMRSILRALYKEPKLNTNGGARVKVFKLHYQHFGNFFQGDTIQSDPPIAAAELTLQQSWLQVHSGLGLVYIGEGILSKSALRRELELEQGTSPPLQAILRNNSVYFGDEGVERDADGRVATAEGEMSIVGGDLCEPTIHHEGCLQYEQGSPCLPHYTSLSFSPSWTTAPAYGTPTFALYTDKLESVQKFATKSSQGNGTPVMMTV